MSEQHPDVDELVARLRARVEERRQSGEYPPGLEEDLAAHFRRIVAHRADRRTDDLRDALAALDRAAAFDPRRIPVGSDMPGGQALHRMVTKLVARQTQGILEQVQVFADGVRSALTAIVQAIEDPARHSHADLVGQVDAINDRLASYERTPVDGGLALYDVRRRVEELEELEERRRFQPWFGNDRFEDAFRGTHDELLSRYRDLAARFDGCSPVLDIGCGRGELLELLRELGVDAAGVELDRALVKAALDDGLAVEHGDGLAALGRLPDASVGGIALIQVVEHLTAQETVDLVALAAQKVRPGGKVIIETVNPQSLYVYAHSFYLDPTHVRPVHPAYLAFLFQEAGFGAVEIDWRSPPPEADVLTEGGDETADANVRRLNQLLFAPQDYALIATR